jgi:hypothetical protein
VSKSYERVSHFRIEEVESVPKELANGVLYVSTRFNTAAHLCPCGCGSRVRTPLTPVAWALKNTRDGPSLYPSVGNWQKPCRSHYFITRGRVVWAEDWTEEEVAAGRAAEEARAAAYYRHAARWNWLRILRTWSLSLMRRRWGAIFDAEGHEK